MSRATLASASLASGEAVQRKAAVPRASDGGPRSSHADTYTRQPQEETVRNDDTLILSAPRRSAEKNARLRVD